MLRDFGEHVCRHWDEPDAGIWETRGDGKHFTHSKALCWVALDRLLELHDRGLLKKIPVDKFKENRRLLRKRIDEEGWCEALQTFTKTLNGKDLDASLLLLAWYGYETPSSDRMRSTFRAVQEGLGAGPGLLYRNHEYREDAFGICGFWAAELLALGAGSLEAVQEQFDAALAYANDVGLFAEEIDPETGDALGIFPQAFTHVGVINAALSIEERARRDEKRPGVHEHADQREAPQ